MGWKFGVIYYKKQQNDYCEEFISMFPAIKMVFFIENSGLSAAFETAVR